MQFQRLDSSGNLTVDTKASGGTCQIEVAEVGAPGSKVRGIFEAKSENGTGVVDVTSGRFSVDRIGK